MGVPPDVEVEQNPADVMAGRDPQLEKAIQVIMEELKKNPAQEPSLIEPGGTGRGRHPLSRSKFRTLRAGFPSVNSRVIPS